MLTINKRSKKINTYWLRNSQKINKIKNNIWPRISLMRFKRVNFMSATFGIKTLTADQNFLNSGTAISELAIKNYHEIWCGYWQVWEIWFVSDVIQINFARHFSTNGVTISSMSSFRTLSVGIVREEKIVVFSVFFFG